MLDAESSVTRPIAFTNRLENVQQDRIGAVANCMNRDWNACQVRFADAPFHGTCGEHVGKQQAAGFRRINVRVEEECGVTAQRSVGEAF